MNTGGAAELTLAFFDRAGKAEPLPVKAGPYSEPRMSPDGRRIAFGYSDRRDTSIWVYDLTAGGSAQRLTFSGQDRFPVWSSDSQRVIFQSDREGDLGLFWQRADGMETAVRLTQPGKGAAHVPQSELGQLSPDAKYVAYVQTDDGQQSVWVRQIASGSTVRILAPLPGLAIWGLTIPPDASFVDVVRSRSGASGLSDGSLARALSWRRATEDPRRRDERARMVARRQAACVFREWRCWGGMGVEGVECDGSQPRVISSRKLPLQFQNLRRASRPDLRPVWFPDGQAIAVYGNDESRAAGESALLSVDAATGASTELYAFGPDHREVTGPRAGMMLGRDGRSLTINLAASGPPQVATVDLRTGQVTRLTNDLAMYGGVSAAGGAIVTTRYRTNSGL